MSHYKKIKALSQLICFWSLVRSLGTHVKRNFLKFRFSDKELEPLKLEDMAEEVCLSWIFCPCELSNRLHCSNQLARTRLVMAVLELPHPIGHLPVTHCSSSIHIASLATNINSQNISYSQTFDVTQFSSWVSYRKRLTCNCWPEGEASTLDSVSDYGTQIKLQEKTNKCTLLINCGMRIVL